MFATAPMGDRGPLHD